jgi:hypothetical protein
VPKKPGFVKSAKKVVEKVKDVAKDVKDEAEDSWDKTKATRKNVSNLYRKAERWAARKKGGKK